MIAFLLPSIALAVYVLLSSLAVHNPFSGEKTVDLRRPYSEIVFAIVLFVIGLHGVVLFGLLASPGVASRAVLMLLGLLFATVGNLLPRTRPNPIIGIRLMRDDPGPPPRGFALRDWAALSMLASQPKSIAARMKETPLRASDEQVQAAGGLGDVPLVVLSPSMPADASARHRRKLELQAAMARLSSRGRHEIIDNPGRMVPYTAPEELIEAIAGILAEVRSFHNEGATRTRPTSNLTDGSER
jgi:hypothetical protein